MDSFGIFYDSGFGFTDADLLLGGMAVLTAVLVIFLIQYLILIIANWKIFEKAGEKGYKSLIPFYAQYILAKITFGNGWFFLLSLVPFVNCIYGIVQALYLCRAFGQENKAIFIILMIFFPYIMALVLAFGNYSYVGSKGRQAPRSQSGALGP